ncbi:hypothetical protein CDIK_1819 [Cucumispora dikerogammari]|nr:hypothetical protein CDIK_1819 [Cucumispora dikerogammari]
MTGNLKPRTTIADGQLNIIRNQINRELNTFTIAENNNLSGSCVLNIQSKIAKGLTNNEIIGKKGRKTTINNIVNNSITTTVAQDNALNQSGISDALRMTGTALSQPTVSRKLKAFQITRKKLALVLAERNSPIVIELRFIYARELGIIQTCQLVFLDETGFNLHTSNNYGYSAVNMKASQTVQANRCMNISLMCGIWTGGVIRYQIQDGAYNGDLFISYI